MLMSLCLDCDGQGSLWKDKADLVKCNGSVVCLWTDVLLPKVFLLLVPQNRFYSSTPLPPVLLSLLTRARPGHHVLFSLKWIKSQRHSCSTLTNSWLLPFGAEHLLRCSMFARVLIAGKRSVTNFEEKREAVQEKRKWHGVVAFPALATLKKTTADKFMQRKLI